MAGLRERKKDDRRKRIFEAALKLFEEAGFEKTSMEKIAEHADLGVGTLYNYYPSKVELLFSIVAAGAGKYVSELEAVVRNSTDLKDSIKEFFQVYLKSFSTYGKRVWRELFREALFKQTECVNLIDSIDIQFCDKLKELLQLLRDRRVIREDTDIQVAASVLYALLGYNVIRYVSEWDMTEAELIEVLMGQAELITKALLK